MKPRRFELVEGSSSKFWEIWVEGSEVHTRYGRIGASGQTTVKDAGDAPKAAKLSDKLVGEKTKKGYAETGAAAASPKAAAPTKGAKAAAPAKAATDYAGAIARVEAKAKAASVKLAKGATDKSIAAAEKAIGLALPDEVKAFYRSHDGSKADAAVEGRELLSLARIVAEWTIWKEIFDRGELDDNGASAPGKGVQKKWWIPEWVPVTYDGAGNHHVIDLAPGRGGTRGQIVSFWHDEPSREVVAKDLLGWLSEIGWGEEDEDEPKTIGRGTRYFFVDDQFWNITLGKDGKSFTVKFGKEGTAGKAKTMSFPDEATAKKEYAKLVAAEEKKGFEEY